MYIIGIAGGSGCGKTTVVRNILEVLSNERINVIKQDSYYKDNGSLTPQERKEMNFDHPDAFDWELLIRHVKTLQAGESIHQPQYDYITSSRLAQTIHAFPGQVLIIEGIMALYNPVLRDMMDLKIFVDADTDVRLIRNIERDTRERGRSTEEVIERYINTLKPMHERFIEPTKRFADLIITQGGKNMKAVDVMQAYINLKSKEEQQNT